MMPLPTMTPTLKLGVTLRQFFDVPPLESSCLPAVLLQRLGKKVAKKKPESFVL